MQGYFQQDLSKLNKLYFEDFKQKTQQCGSKNLICYAIIYELKLKIDFDAKSRKSHIFLANFQQNLNLI